MPMLLRNLKEEAMMAPTLASIFGLSMGELAIVALIVLLLFGGANIRKLARSLGGSVRDFKEELKGGANEAADDQKGPNPPSPK